MSNGRYTLTVTYDEPNPNYRPGESTWGGHQPERLNVHVLTCELTPAQFDQLKRDTLKAWEPQTTGEAK
jgi:hypothetical protein